MSWDRISPFVRRLLTRLLSEQDLRAVISELDELHALREDRVGTARATRAYRRSARLLALQLRGRRARQTLVSGLSPRTL